MKSFFTVICGTNRTGNQSSVVAEHCKKLLQNKGMNVRMLRLESLPADFIFNNDTFGNKNPKFSKLVKKYIAEASSFMIIVPEYNGSMPGVLKAFIDGIEPKIFVGKKAALVGVAAGRSGNLRGMDHLTNILNYLGVTVFPLKIPVSRVMQIISNDEIADPETRNLLDKQVEGFIKF